MTFAHFKEKIIQHVETSVFRHNFMWPVVVVSIIFLAIVEMLALVGEAYVLENPVAGTSVAMSTFMYIVMQAAIYGMLLIIVGLLGYFLFIWGTHQYLIFRKVVTHEEHPLDGPVYGLYISGKTMLAMGAIYYILGITTVSIVALCVLALSLVMAYLPNSVSVWIMNHAKNLLSSFGIY